MPKVHDVLITYSRCSLRQIEHTSIYTLLKTIETLYKFFFSGFVCFAYDVMIFWEVETTNEAQSEGLAMNWSTQQDRRSTRLERLWVTPRIPEVMDGSATRLKNISTGSYEFLTSQGKAEETWGEVTSSPSTSGAWWPCCLAASFPKGLGFAICRVSCRRRRWGLGWAVFRTDRSSFRDGQAPGRRRRWTWCRARHWWRQLTGAMRLVPGTWAKCFVDILWFAWLLRPSLPRWSIVRWQGVLRACWHRHGSSRFPRASLGHLALPCTACRWLYHLWLCHAKSAFVPLAIVAPAGTISWDTCVIQRLCVCKFKVCCCSYLGYYHAQVLCK